MSIAKGDKAPAFELPASGGRTISSASLAGKPYVLYFYPKADTPGCTKEACGFQDSLPDFARLGLEVIGVSRDPIKALDKFAEKYKLAFPLASDEAGALSDAYGVWVEKSMYGKTYMGLERSSFLIDSKGTVAEAWHKVKVPGHVAAVAKAAADLHSHG
jgi:peroxiredoxin Q/BCP